jgi:hypothetical protein
MKLLAGLMAIVVVVGIRGFAAMLICMSMMAGTWWYLLFRRERHGRIAVMAERLRALGRS